MAGEKQLSVPGTPVKTEEAKIHAEKIRRALDTLVEFDGMTRRQAMTMMMALERVDVVRLKKAADAATSIVRVIGQSATEELQERVQA